MQKILVVGSIGYDFVFEIHGRIKDKITAVESKIESLDLLFTAKNLNKRFGGTAGNISYGLALLGEAPLMSSVVGEDFLADYNEHVKKLGIETRLVVIPNGYTATFYAASDEEKNLIGVWQPNSYSSVSNHPVLENIKELKNVKYAIFSPGTDKSITKHIKEVKTNNPKTKTIFDPGQIVNFFDDKLMSEAVDYADIIIGNEVEIPIIENKLSTTVKKLSKQKIVIQTLGEKGVTIYHSEVEKVEIPAVKVENFTEATGAGDAFRSGLLFGLSNDMSLEDAVKIGTYTGAENVKTYGGQTYKLSKETKIKIKKLLKEEK